MAILGKNYPDPFSNKTKIPYSVNSENQGKIIIKDILGKTMTEITVISDEHVITVNTEKWAEGVYLYTLYINGEIIASKKMILAK